MKLLNTVFLFLFVTTIISTQQVLTHIVLHNKDFLKKRNYKTKMEWLLEYVPLSGIKEIYLRGSSSILINTIFFDNESIDYYPAFVTSFTAEKEIYNDSGTVRKMLLLEYFPDLNCWTLMITPHGNSSDGRWYDIPKGTREVDIYYNILYPNQEISEEFHSKIIIREKWNSSKTKERSMYRYLDLLISGVFIIGFFSIIINNNQRRSKC